MSLASHPYIGDFVCTFQFQELCNCRDVNWGRHKCCYARKLIDANPYVEPEKVNAPRLVSYHPLPELAVFLFLLFLVWLVGYFAVFS